MGTSRWLREKLGAYVKQDYGRQLPTDGHPWESGNREGRGVCLVVRRPHSPRKGAGIVRVPE